MMKFLNFVYDKKSGDFLAANFVPNHSVALRSYATMVDNKDLIFVKFPKDFELITVEVAYENDCFGIGESAIACTPFVDIVGDNNGSQN